MRPISYANTIRVRKSKFFSHFSKKLINFQLLFSWILIISGLVLVFAFGLRYLAGLISLGLMGLMFSIWVKWDLSSNKAQLEVNSKEIRLDKELTSDIVFLINDKMSPRQVLGSIYTNWQAMFIFNRYQIDPKILVETLSDNPSDSIALWNKSNDLASKVPIKEISAGVIVTSMIVENPEMQKWLQSNEMDSQDILGGLNWEESLWERIIKPKNSTTYGGIGRDWASGYTPILDKFGQNISLAIIDGNRDFSGVKRGHVIESMLSNLTKSGRNNLAIVGEVGVGKTALVYALAEKLISGNDVPDSLKYKQIVQIDSALVTSSVSKDLSLELVFNEIINNAAKAGNIILYFDEAQLFFGKGGGTVDISGILLPALQSSGVNIITSFSLDDWHKLSTNNTSLAGLFSKVDVAPSDRDQTIGILQDLSIAIESNHDAIITFKAIQAAYDLSERYVRTKAMPARAIDLLVDSMNYPESGLITSNSVAKAVEIITNTKVSEASKEEKSQLINLEDLIHQRMINQTRAVKVVSDALRRSRAGVRNTNRPVGSFLFLGPTGVGKTELTKALASVYFGKEENINRLDMSEYQNKSDIKRLLAAPTQQDAGSGFLQKINQNPFSVVLLDEIEKAHPDILNLLLQMLDEGSITDMSGHKVSFKESIIICTSNAGANEIRQQIEMGKKLEDFESQFIDSLINSNIFKPELINRFDEVVLFRPLTKEELLQVAGLIINGVNKELEAKKVSIKLTQEAMQYLVDLGYDPRLGARPMRRVVSRLVENLIAKRLLSGEITSGSSITLDVNDLKDVG
jgi:ATP-dependent Clp protease ATP-binding subunit ClpC